MLESLDKIDWSKLIHAYGSAADVPDVIRDLASPDPATSRDALSELYGNIWHQGSVYEATAYAVPFLVEVLESAPHAGRAGILHLLQSIAGGSSFLDVHQQLDWYHKQRETSQFRADLEREIGWVQAAREAVVQAVPTYIRCLGDGAADVRTLAGYVLAACKERREEIEPPLRRQIQRETEAGAKASMVLGLGCLWHWSVEQKLFSDEEAAANLRYMNDLMIKPAEGALVRMAAAMSYGQLVGARLCPEVLPVLRETIPVSAKSFSESPWCDGDTLITVIRFLQKQPALCLQLLLELLRHADLDLRKEAVYTLDNLCRERRSLPVQVAPALGDLLHDSDGRVREWAATALAQFGSAARLAVEPLRAALNDPAPRVRSSAAVALTKLRDEQALPGIQKLLGHPETCATALGAIKAFGPAARNVIPRLRKMLRHGGDGQHVLKVAQAVASLGPEARQAMPELIAALRQPDAAGGVAWALAMLGPDAWEAVSDLAEVLDSEDSFTRRNAAKALGRIGPAAVSAVPALNNCCEDPDGSVRAEAAFALWQIEGEAGKALAVLMDVLRRHKDSTKRDDQYICSIAAEFLGQFSETASSAVPLLRETLIHESHWVRVHSAVALWQITRRAEEVLLVLLQELQCRPAGLEVLRCLADMGPLAKPAVKRLKEIIDSEFRLLETGVIDSWVDDDEAFRSAAVLALERINEHR
jgi:HEAT repeat protein